MTDRPAALSAEQQRLQENETRTANWKRWGPYLPERQWGTVREDYSAEGDAWRHFTHDEARSRAYRWGDDGLLGWCDRQCRLCFGVALWNGRDPILKERLFGLAGPEGNHGEDVKEVYYYLDSTPTHSYAKAMYRYPHAEFPYARLLEENRRRGRSEREFELEDTGVLDDRRYTDVVVEYAKASPDDTLIRVTCHNRGPEEAELWVLPTFWFRNTWIWGCRHEGCGVKPNDGGSRRVDLPESSVSSRGMRRSERVRSPAFGPHPDRVESSTELLFTENETNTDAELFGIPNLHDPTSKTHSTAISSTSEAEAVNPATPRHKNGRACTESADDPPAGESAPLIGARLTFARRGKRPTSRLGRPRSIRTYCEERVSRKPTNSTNTCDAPRNGQRRRQRALFRGKRTAGLLWTKQFYHYIVDDWLERRSAKWLTPPAERQNGGRNHDLAAPVRPRRAFNARQVGVPLVRRLGPCIPHAARWRAYRSRLRQVGNCLLLMREWYMHPNGQLPAYEFAF